MAKRPGNSDSDDARRKRPENGDQGGRGGGYGGGQEGGGEPERGESGEHRIFLDMVQRRMGGGAPPSTAAYARAMRQWQQMPGAVGFTAVPSVSDEPPPGDPPPEQPPSDGKPGAPDDGGIR